MANTLEINGNRLWDTLTVSASIGVGAKGGLSRLALTDHDKNMRDLFVSWCQEADCSITVDRVGNIFARRAGVDSTLKPVLIGSHLDTQIAGGRFDGNLGVLAGLEVIRVFNDHEVRTKRPIEVVCWTNEEGVRFQPPMMGAGAFAGVHDIDWILGQIDDAGNVFEDELVRIGYAGKRDHDRADIDSYFELHIEQGPILEQEGINVGIVTGGFTSFGAEVCFTGENGHSGSAPMNARKDALVAAALVVAKVNEIGWAYEPTGRATCVRMGISPNRYGIIADRVQVTLDVRHSEPALAEEMYGKAIEAIQMASEYAHVDKEITKEWSFGDPSFDTELISLLRSVSVKLGVPHRHIMSAAGHDAYHVAKIAPAAMIFTPCKGGITHNESENISIDDTIPGVNVLLNAVLRRAMA